MRGILLGAMCLIGCAQEPPPTLPRPAPSRYGPSSLPSHDDEKLKATLEKLKADQTRVATEFRDAEARRKEAEIRAHPMVPEWGATAKEARQICEKQGGRFSKNDDGLLTCSVGDAKDPIFAARVKAKQIDRIDTYIEGADVTSERDRLVGHFGPYEAESVVQGFRVWEWPSKGFFLTSYEHGTLFANYTPGEP